MLPTRPDVLSELVELAPDAMLLVDSTGTIVYANKQVSTLFGHAREQIVGRSVECLLPERFRDRHCEHRRRFAENGRMRPMGAGLELYGRRVDATEFPIEISLSPLGAGFTAAAIRDVSERKRVERELMTAREAADSAREEADRANHAKSRFLATASHDLRQPLQTLAMLNGALRRTNVSAQALEAILQQQHAIDAMKRLLNALLDIGKLESGAVKPEMCDTPLRPLLEELGNEFSTAAAEKGLKLYIDAPVVSVHTDTGLLEQVLRNLVANAIKYTAAGEVSVRIGCEAGWVRIAVCDTGIGIAADQLNRIFDEFYQVGVATNSTRDGYGLGLAIVQRIVKLLGIRLEVASNVGSGSAFTLVLAAAGQTGTAPSQPPPYQQGHPVVHGRLLLVEDEPGVRKATQLLLSTEGYDVTVASSRVEALELATRESFDVLVTDYHLGGSDTGLDLIGDVRVRTGKRLPAILVTGDTSSALRKLRHDPAVRLASKPINAEELIGMVGELMATARFGA